ncbi:hypothetical protein D1007_42401 [Hordeum vulgare]|nr:hypothetical protein D1007_42401 [Hordeum vulgare]
MTFDEEERLVHAMMEDTEREFKRLQEEEWEGLGEMTRLSAAGDVYFVEVDMKHEVKDEVMQGQPSTPVWNPTLYGQEWSWTTTVSCSTPSPLPTAPPAPMALLVTTRACRTMAA